VDLIGKYVVQRSEWADQYFPTIAERITDSGLSVRKRVVKLLRDMCAAADNEATKVKICVTLIKAVEDEDDGIKDLALKSLSDILFPSSFKSTTTAKLLVDILDETRSSEEHLVKRALEGVSVASRWHN
jgi:cohesin loading factor subunit SCC2